MRIELPVHFPRPGTIHSVPLENMAALRDQLAAPAAAAASSPVEKEKKSVYPYIIDESLDVDAQIKQAKGFIGRINNDKTDSKRYPYYYAEDESESEDYLLPLSQQLFLQAFAPRNITILPIWFTLYEANFKLADRRDVIALIQRWAGSGSGAIQSVVSELPHAPADLLSLLPLVEQGVKPDYLPRGRGVTEREAWKFYQLLFMPNPQRVGVPLPIGVALFEGRAGGTVSRITELVNHVRVPSFSTTWHPDVALSFAWPGSASSAKNNWQKGNNVLFVHTVMSDGILGVTIPSEIDQVGEAEVIVQPLVRLHLIAQEHVIGIERHEGHSPRGRSKPCFIHVMFTHMYLGDKCPCQVMEDTSSEGEHVAKRQRLASRLRVVLNGDDDDMAPSPSHSPSLASLSSHLDSDDEMLSSHQWSRRQPIIDDPTLPPDDTTPRTLQAWREKHFPTHPPEEE